MGVGVGGCGLYATHCCVRRHMNLTAMQATVEKLGIL